VSTVCVKFGRNGVASSELPLKLTLPPISDRRCSIVFSIDIYFAAGVDVTWNVDVGPVAVGAVRIVESDDF